MLYLEVAQLERQHLAAGGARRGGEPHGGIAVRGAEFQDAACLPAARQQVQQDAGLAAHGQQQVVQVGAGGAGRHGAALFFLGATFEIGEHAFNDGIDQGHRETLLLAGQAVTGVPHSARKA
jgi:hypothetical protein